MHHATLSCTVDIIAKKNLDASIFKYVSMVVYLYNVRKQMKFELVFTEHADQ